LSLDVSSEEEDDDYENAATPVRMRPPLPSGRRSMLPTGTITYTISSNSAAAAAATPTTKVTASAKRCRRRRSSARFLTFNGFLFG
jgi:hypothetical protein